MKSVLNIHWKDWCWNWTSNTLATWWEELTNWKRPWCQERLRVGGEEDDRGWNGLMASLTRWTWVWASSGSWWWTGRPGVLQSMRTQLRNWTELTAFIEDGQQVKTYSFVIILKLILILKGRASSLTITIFFYLFIPMLKGKKKKKKRPLTFFKVYINIYIFYITCFFRVIF